MVESDSLKTNHVGAGGAGVTVKVYFCIPQRLASLFQARLGDMVFRKCLAVIGLTYTTPVARRNRLDKQRSEMANVPLIKRMRFEISLAVRIAKHYATGRLRFGFFIFWITTVTFFALAWAELEAELSSSSLLLKAIENLFLRIGLTANPKVIFLAWLLSPLAFGTITSWLICKLQDRRRIPFGFCRKCRYDLRGSDNAVCPECGTPRVPTKTNERP